MSSCPYRRAACPALLSLCWALVLPAQQSDSGLTARQLFYTERPKPAKPSTPAPPPASTKRRTEAPAHSSGKAPVPPSQPESIPFLGLRYSVLQLTGGSRLQEVNPDAVFHSGDRIKVKVTPNSRGYLYVVHQGSSGNWDVLFPTEGFRQGSNLVERLESVSIPEGDLDFRFDEKTGTERLFVVLSGQPERDLDALIYSIRGGQNSGPRTLVAGARIPAGGIERLRTGLVSRDLKVERRPTAASSSGREEAVYVVNASTSNDNGRVVAEISLRHE